jgi:hypothetical protein
MADNSNLIIGMVEPHPGSGASSVRHSYPLVVRDPSLSVAIGLMMRSLPYAIARFGVLMGASVAVLIWLIVMIGGAAWLGSHVASVFGLVWFIMCLAGGSFLWLTMLRYLLHLIECGHVAVLTELITKGSIGNGSESMFAYGKRVVTERFAETNVLFGLNALVRGIVKAFHRTLDWISEIIPIPGLESIAKLINIILQATTRYLDKVIFSYSLARNDGDPWRSSREGLIYYAQNAKPVLKTAIWSLILERVLTIILWLALLIPAGLITLALPHSMREFGGFMTIVLALLVAASLRAAIIKPLFLIMMMVRFHSSIEGQAINPEWDERLSKISDKFRDLGQDAAAAMGKSRWMKG